ncbi:hypothetical protein K438DRAFT_1786460 [Mycena galopus ATCC 62051]|nr:hypothetical protein K438DRAFT_1786460 [Mycena galopus ATCC 62051]
MSSVALCCRFLLLALCWQSSCAALEASSGGDSPYGYARAITSERWRDWTKKKQDPLPLFDATTDSTPSLSSRNSLTLHSAHMCMASTSPGSVCTHRHGTQASTAESMAEYRARGGGKWVLPMRAMTHILPCPLPIHPGGAGRLLVVLGWCTAPCVGRKAGVEVLQLMALGERSLELLKVPLAAPGAQMGLGLGTASGSGFGTGNGYASGNGKDKACSGWTSQGWCTQRRTWAGRRGSFALGDTGMQHTASVASDMSAQSADSGDVVERLRLAQGCMAGVAKDLWKWRVFWVRGGFNEWEDEEEDE